MSLRGGVLRLGRAIQRRERRLVPALVLVALVSMAVSAYLLRPTPRAIIHYRPTPGPETYYPLTALLAALIGGLALSFALLLAAHRFSFPLPEPPHLDRLIARGWWPLLPGIAVLGVVAEANGQWLKIPALRSVSHDGQCLLLGSGIMLVALGLTGVLPRQVHRSVSLMHRCDLALLGLLTLGALLVRLYRLDDAARMMIDESHFLMGVMYFWHFDDVRLLEPMPTNASFPFLFSYGMHWGVTLAGRTFAGLRLFSVVLGALTVPAVYLLARYLYDRLTAVIAALVLLAYPPHIHYSRLALNNIADPLFGTLAFALTARALHTSRRSDYVLAGVALGLTQYFYEGGRLLFPLVMLAWLGTGALLWRPRPAWRGVILLALAFALTAAPIYYTLLGLDHPLVNRLDQTRLDEVYWDRQREDDSWLTPVRHFHHALMSYVHMPENTLVYYYLYYGGKHPLVLEPLVPLFLLGAVIAAWRWRTPGTLPTGWLLANVLGNAFLVESAVSARYVTTFPAVALLIAVGLRYTVGLLWPDSARRQALRAALLVAAALGIAVGQIAYYFVDHLPVFETEIREPVQADVEDALWRARDFPPMTHVHLVGDRLLPEGDAQRFANFVTDGLYVRAWPAGTLTAKTLIELPRAVDHAFFVPHNDFNTQRLLVAMFGPAPFQATDQGIPVEKTLLLYYLPALH